MDINIQWVSPTGTAVVDYFNVLYKEFDLYPPLNGLNDWILATDPPLPPTQLNYTITGLKENTVYRIMVTKACTGLTEIVDEITFIRTGYPIIGTWQGPVVNNYPTLFYSVYYPEGSHIRNALVKLYDTETYDRMLIECGAPDPAYVVVGRNGYLTGAVCPPIGNSTNVYCDLQSLDYLLPSNTSSAVSYFGRDNSAIFPPICDGTGAQPLLLKYNNDYKLYSGATPRFPSTFLSIDPASSESAINWPAFTFPSDPTQPYPNLNTANISNISDAICFDPLTAVVDYTYADGTGRTNIANYLFSFVTSDGVNSLPLLDNSGNPITSNNGSYNIYAPIKIQSVSVPPPGGGNALGYTITGASVLSGNTTYTYTGGTNVFTVGQDVFVNNVNPISFNFSLTSKTIIAATSNSFTVSFNPVGTYQTGGTASTYIELTNDMTITVDLQPAQNVIILTNQNYLGLTLIQALNQIAGAINAAGTYTASAVVVGGYPYLKINVPDTSFGSASIIFEGPNILTKGAPDILQNSVAYGPTTVTTNGSVNYNGFLYSSYDLGALIIGSDINTQPTVATNYSHPIDIGVYGLELVDEPAPSIAYSLDHVGSGGDYSLNIAIDNTTGYAYTADNTTVSVYDGKIFIDSQDLSALPGGPTTPIRLMEFNNTDNTLYVFVDSSGLDNFFIVDVAPWSIITSGVYGQTNYLERSTVTAWNNLTSGTTAAIGRIDVAPTAPIPCGTAPCPILPAVWQIGRNDGIQSALFQDTTKSWGVVPPTTNLIYGSEFNVYNYNTQQLGAKMFYNGTTYNNLSGVSGNTVAISAAMSSTLPLTYSPFTPNLNDDFGFFHYFRIVDYNANFTSRTWENTARYLIEDGRNKGANGFFTATFPTQAIPDDYSRSYPTGEKKINSVLGLDGTSEYLLYEIKDGGTCYSPLTNLVYVSLDGGVIETIDSFGNVTPFQLYKDFLTGSTIPVAGSLQLVADPNTLRVYGIARDARSAINDMNIYVFNNTGQIDVIEGSTRWNIPICGQLGFDPVVSHLYFTGKNTRKIIRLEDPGFGANFWTIKDVPSVYEKLNGFTYGDGSVIERIQGASIFYGEKIVVMNYLQQTCITQLKYTYDVANLFIYDFGTNTVEQVLIGTGVSSYSGPAASYNLNYYGESFGINDYNNDYCYGGLSIKTNPNTGQVFWKKSISDQVYFSEGHAESGIAQIWGSGTGPVGTKLIRIWNVQNDGLGTLVPSKRTILDIFSTLNNFEYDSYYNKVLTYAGTVGSMFQFYMINPKTLGGIHGVNTVSPFTKNAFSGSTKTVAALCPTGSNDGKSTNVYAVVVTPTDITYSVRPTSASINGYFPHQYAVGEVVTITGIVSSPVDQLNFPNSDTGPNVYATITAVTQTTFTIANTYNATATYTSGGVVRDAKWVNISGNNYFTKIKSSQNGDIILIGQIAFNSGSTGINTSYSSFIFKYEPNDILTQRENPQIINTGITSSVCSATPDGLFTDFRAAYQKTNSFMIHVPSQNTYWILGTKNPTCNTSNITNAVYDAGTQTVRYFINNSFLVGKIVDISGITPSAYNVASVAITAVDTLNSPQQWFEISYTGADPGTFIPPTPPLLTGQVSLSPFYIIKVLDDNTFATIATIDLGFNNSFVSTLVGGFFIDRGRFQYSAATEEIYMYSDDPTYPVYVFSTVTNALVRSSNFNRMVTPYTKLNNVAMLEDVNGVPYFIAYTGLDTPNRRWFRIGLGSRVYLNSAHNLLTTTVSDAVGSFGFSYNFYGSYATISDTFGQWKDILDTTWATIPSTITTTLNSTIEFVSFKMDSPIMSIVNNVTGYNYPVSNTLNYVPVYSILIDNVNILNGDALNFTFANPDNPSCPFTRQITIYF